MKTRKSRTAVANPADWKDDEWIEVLAWANYTLEIDPSGNLFTESIVQHLGEACQVEYELSQIKTKLGAIWKGHGRYCSTKRNLIYLEGSSCLENLDASFHELITKRTNIIAHEKFLEHLSTRATRSASRSGSASLWLPDSSLDIGIATSPSPRKKARIVPIQRSPCPKGKDVAKGCIQESFEGDAIIMPKQERWHTPPDTLRRQLIIRDSFNDDISDHDAESEYEQSTQVRSATKIRDVIPLPGFSSSTRATSGTLSLQSASGDIRTNAANKTDSGNKSEEYTHRLERELHTLNQRYTRDIAFYRSEQERTEKESEQFKRELKSLQSVFSTRLSNASLEKLLTESRTENMRLHHTLKDRTLQNFSSLSTNDPMPLDKKFIDDQMQSMANWIKCLAEFDDTEFSGGSSFGEGKELVALLSRGFSYASGDLLPSDLEKMVPKNFKFSELIRTLVVAAVCFWVFESPFDVLNESTHCPLLDQYRRCLERQDGPNALRNLDFAAHSMLLKEEFFQNHVISTEAGRLTSRLCHALEPLFAQRQKLGFEPKSSIYMAINLDTDESQIDDRSNVKEIFRSALRIKARLVTSTDAFEAVMHAPGSTFNSETMVAENFQGMQVHPRLHEKLEIKFCYLPSLLVHRRGAHMVDQNNFVRSTEVSRSECRCYIRALVEV